MEFKKLKNIEENFKELRIYAIAFAGLCLLICLCCIYFSFHYANMQRKKIYVLDQGKSLILALQQDASMNRPVEGREEVRRFHELFFTIAPDKDAIQSNLKRAFILADKSAYRYYQDLAEKNFYQSMINGNIMQRIQIDSMKSNFKIYPYQVVTYATEFIIRHSNITKRALVTKCDLINTVKSDDNPQGFLIENFEVLKNKDIGTYKR